MKLICAETYIATTVISKINSNMLHSHEAIPLTSEASVAFVCLTPHHHNDGLFREATVAVGAAVSCPKGLFAAHS